MSLCVCVRVLECEHVCKHVLTRVYGAIERHSDVECEKMFAPLKWRRVRQHKVSEMARHRNAKAPSSLASEMTELLPPRRRVQTLDNITRRKPNV